jgi:iron complex transport system ATP-binding protein
MADAGKDHIISLQNFSIGFQQENVLLGNLNLCVEGGEMVAVIGRNGTGKSTLLRSLIGLLPSLGGECLLQGKSIKEYDLPSRARLASFVSSQARELPSLSVGEMVALGRLPYTGWMGRLSPADHARVDEALEEVQMSSFKHRKLDRLSDGERQRAMIARAFVQDTDLMVLDEPTAFLDIPNTYDLVRILSRFRDAGKSIVYSTHDLETAMQCADKMWIIHEGKIFEGAPEDLGLSGLFDELFASSEIHYEEQNRKFMFKAAGKGSINLIGKDDRTSLWTKSALDRLGYRIHKEGEILLEIRNCGSKCEWVLEMDGVTDSFSSLYKLARYLIQAK